MRILILANYDLGLYKFRKELIEELIKLNHEVYISLPYGDLIRPLEQIGCIFIDTPVDRRGINPFKDLSLLKNYRKMIKSISPDLIISYTIKPNIYGGFAARKAKVKYAVNITGLGTAFEKRGLVKAIVVILYKFALKNARVVFFENSSNRDALLSIGCCKKEQTVVLNGAGVNTEIYSYIPYPQNDRMKFLFIGRVMKEKGVDELFSAIKLLISDGYDCCLDVIGPFEENYKDQLEKYESDGWLKYYGYQEDVRPFIAQCDCFVLPSYHEGMANTNLECASSGRPIITSDIPGCKEAVNNASGFLCQPRDVKSLYKAMKKMIDMEVADRANMGKAGRCHMQAIFEKRQIVKQTINNLF